MPEQRKRRRSRSASKLPAHELDEAQRLEAERIAFIAKQAEERAAERRAKDSKTSFLQSKHVTTGERKLPMKIEEASVVPDTSNSMPKFRSKAQREKDALARLEKKQQEVKHLIFSIIS
ncbi:hypothetical protein CCR75_009009 [Bremia lactucae]|uniref:Uncharacterized protein n=1 Tax=Bremia lactucae TaxID=4779 RepID=A0A976IHB3_BRELC|nr:hypothetical protein CCR75_009009 [Bremia lactucae]